MRNDAIKDQDDHPYDKYEDHESGLDEGDYNNVDNEDDSFNSGGKTKSDDEPDDLNTHETVLNVSGHVKAEVSDDSLDEAADDEEKTDFPISENEDIDDEAIADDDAADETIPDEPIPVTQKEPGIEDGNESEGQYG